MMTEVTMTMSNLHPGFILIAVGLIALFVPKVCAGRCLWQARFWV